MTIRDIFGLIVRLTGLGFAVMAFLDAVHVVLHLLGADPQSSYGAGPLALATVSYGLAGFALLFGADRITALAYRSADRSSESPPS
jgi:hypothetical protein